MSEIVIAIAAFAGCAAGVFGGHYYTTHKLSVYFDEIAQKFSNVKNIAVVTEHKVCDFCKNVVAKFEVIDGKVKCANCKAEGK